MKNLLDELEVIADRHKDIGREGCFWNTAPTEEEILEGLDDDECN